MLTFVPYGIIMSPTTVKVNSTGIQSEGTAKHVTPAEDDSTEKDETYLD